MTDEMTERHVRAAQVLQGRVIQRLAAMDAADVAKMEPADVLRMWIESVKVERSSRSNDLLAAELGFDDAEIDVTTLDDAALVQLAQRVGLEKRRRSLRAQPPAKTLRRR